MPAITEHQLSEFADVFVRLGWRGIENIFGRRTSINERLIQHLGDDLLARRREYMRAQRMAA